LTIKERPHTPDHWFSIVIAVHLLFAFTRQNAMFSVFCWALLFRCSGSMWPSVAKIVTRRSLEQLRNDVQTAKPRIFAVPFWQVISLIQQIRETSGTHWIIPMPCCSLLLSDW
jgi:hypothetical protein